MNIGITGTRDGMTAEQERAFRSLIAVGPVGRFHHGSCQGVDVEAARIVRELYPGCWIVAHLGPDGDPCRSISGVDNETRAPKTHFCRNRAIVDETERLIAVPKQPQEMRYGGTWYTVSYARKARKPHVIVWPDGALHYSRTEEH